VNPEAIYLLFRHAFENGGDRLDLKTDARNSRSRAAISGLGGRLGSVLGATPHEFESRILRRSEDPHR